MDLDNKNLICFIGGIVCGAIASAVCVEQIRKIEEKSEERLSILDDDDPTLELEKLVEKLREQ